MPSLAAADITIVGLIHFFPTNEADAGLQNSFVLFDRVVLEEYVLCSPETPGGKVRHLRGCACRSRQLNQWNCRKLDELTGASHWFDSCVLNTLFC